MLRALLLCTVFAASLSAQQFGKVQLWDVLENGKTQKIKGSLKISDDGLSFTGKNGKNVSFAYADIESLTYEREAPPLYKTGLLFRGGERHFLTVHGIDETFAIFRLYKGSYRQILTVIEAKSRHAIAKAEER